VKKEPGQLEHVVGVAGLHRPFAQPVAEPPGSAEMLVFPVSARGIGVIPRDGFPEKPRHTGELRLARYFIKPGGSDQFRDVCVPVKPLEPVLSPGERGP